MTPLEDRILDRLLENRIVMASGEVTDEMAQRVISQLLLLANDDTSADILMYINSPGGSVIAGLGIYDIMQLVPNDVVTVAVGLAASMGQVLLCAGTHGKRLALPNAQVLLHEGSAGIAGAAADVEIQAQHLSWTLDRMRHIIADHTGRSLDAIAEEVGRDQWFDAEGALAYGFIDRIVVSLAEIAAPPRRATVGLAAGRQ